MLNAGVIVKTRDDQQRTPLHWAALGGNEAVVRLLQAQLYRRGHSIGILEKVCRPRPEGA